MGMQLIETVTVGSGGAASISFTSIPQDGVDLLILISSRIVANPASAIKLDVNGSTLTTWRRLYGTGSTATSDSNSNNSPLGFHPGALQTANTFGNNAIYISNYTSTGVRSVSADGVAENNNTAANAGISTTTVPSGSAVTSLAVSDRDYASNLVEHSTASLYKITAD